MGLIDRDYMHEKRSGSASMRAPDKSATGTLFKVLIVVAALFLLYKLAGWQLAKRTNTSAAESMTASTSTPRQTPRPRKTSPQAQPQHSSPHPSNHHGHRLAAHRNALRPVAERALDYLAEFPFASCNFHVNVKR